MLVTVFFSDEQSVSVTLLCLTDITLIAVHTFVLQKDFLCAAQRFIVTVTNVLPNLQHECQIESWLTDNVQVSEVRV